MKKIFVITPKAKLAELFKEKLERLHKNEVIVELLKQIPRVNREDEVSFIILDEKVAVRGIKKELKVLLKLKESFEDVRIIVFGNDDLDLRMQTKIDGADDYISLQMLTSPMFDTYLSKIIFQN